MRIIILLFLLLLPFIIKSVRTRNKVKRSRFLLPMPLFYHELRQEFKNESLKLDEEKNITKSNNLTNNLSDLANVNFRFLSPSDYISLKKWNDTQLLFCLIFICILLCAFITTNYFYKTYERKKEFRRAFAEVVSAKK